MHSPHNLAQINSKTRFSKLVSSNTKNILFVPQEKEFYLAHVPKFLSISNLTKSMSS